ncbi:MAG: DUF6261 family protein [Tannerellaceae bacterium]|jgi:hypothetical protein|nr:DUF6261 family protein [Tannerellaceae bacterium]
MKMIRFLMRRLRNEEWLRFHTEFYEQVEEFGVEMLGFKHLFTPYTALYREAWTLLEILRKSFITTDSARADARRKDVFLGLRNTAKYLRMSLSNEKQQAAVKVYAMVEKYDKVIRKGSLSAKTAAVDNLLQNLTPGNPSPNLSQEVEALHMKEWVADLTFVNEAYKQSLTERAEELAERPGAGRLRQVRAAMDHHYLGMMNIVDTHLLIMKQQPEGEEEILMQFARKLNSCIARYKSLLKGRHTRNQNKPPEEEEEAFGEL